MDALHRRYHPDYYIAHLREVAENMGLTFEEYVVCMFLYRLEDIQENLECIERAIRET